MPIVKFPYGKEFLELNIPEARFAGKMESHMHSYKPAGTPEALVKEAMANPIALNYVSDTTQGDKAYVAYATVYPLCMFLRVIIAQIIVMLWFT